MIKKESKKNRKILFLTFIIAVVTIIVIANKGTIFESPKYKKESNRKVPITPEDLVPTEHANIEKDSTETNVPVPKGYVGSPITEGFTFTSTSNSETMTISDGGENTINTGFVIYEKLEGESDSQAKANILADPWTAQCTRNQFVWVPVPDPSTIYGTDSNGKKWGKLYKFNATNEDNITGTSPLNWSETDGVMRITDKKSYCEADILTYYDKTSNLEKINLRERTPHDFLIQMEKEFEESIDNIEKYGGFYIGRYETGGLSDVAKIVKGDTDLDNQTWYTIYKKSKYLKGNNENVTTNMIFDSQWDRTLMWLIESGNKTKAQIASDSGEWGNYNGQTLKYINIDEKIILKDENRSLAIPSGSSEYTRANNVYDLAGNEDEWTMGKTKFTTRTLRGGYAYTIGASCRRGESAPISCVGEISSRAALYIK